MIPFGNQSVILLARTRTVGKDGRSRDEWTQHTLTGCSWRAFRIQNVDTNAVRTVSETICRIPVGQRRPEVGDVLILGARGTSKEALTAHRVNELLENNRGTDAFRVESVRDNAMPGFPAPHYVAKG